MFRFITKPIGLTPKQIQNNCKLNNYYHTGNLDVLAFGEMLFISNRLRILEKFFKKLKKTYTFTLLAGFSTDTHDILGIITKIELKNNKITKKSILEAINKIKQQQYQIPPKVSYKNLNTKAKLTNFLNGLPLKKLPPKKTKIIKINYISCTGVKKKNVINSIFNQINYVTIPYRQNIIKKSYNKNYNNLPKIIYKYKFKAKVTSGFYIRAIARDLSKELNIPLTCINIKREKIGF